jgi:Hemerythrin HHE cation binding domain
VTTPDSQSMTDALRSDHRAIAAELGDPSATSDTEEAGAKREQLVMNLVRHFVAEEQYLYPEVRDRLERGDDIAETNFAADRTMEAKLKQLEDSDLTAQRLGALWADLHTAFAAHTERQNGIFTDLESVSSPDRLAHLGDEVLGAEELAPTRPRSIAPSSPGWNKVVSLVEGYVDHVRDHYEHRGEDPDETG